MFPAGFPEETGRRSLAAGSSVATRRSCPGWWEMMLLPEAPIKHGEDDGPGMKQWARTWCGVLHWLWGV